MSVAVSFVDESLGGSRDPGLTLEFLTERVTLRELIRSRVYQEVSEHNARLTDTFRGLVQPEGSERIQGGYRLRTPRPLDWEAQYEHALRAFQHNGFIVIVNDRQVEELDDEVELAAGAEVCFLRLVPLVGG